MIAEVESKLKQFEEKDALNRQGTKDNNQIKGSILKKPTRREVNTGNSSDDYSLGSDSERHQSNSEESSQESPGRWGPKTPE